MKLLRDDTAISFSTSVFFIRKIRKHNFCYNPHIKFQLDQLQLDQLQLDQLVKFLIIK